MTKDDFCSECEYRYDIDRESHKLFIQTARDLGLCEDNDPEREDCFRHEEWEERMEEEE